MSNAPLSRAQDLASLAGSVDAVLFDCFGTLLQITHRSDPYRILRDALPSVSTTELRETLLTRPEGPLHIARHFGHAFSDAQAADLASALAVEMDSIRPYRDTFAVLDALTAAGLRLAVCSNLSHPYVAPARELLGGYVDGFVWSCYFGACKPNPRIFAHACELLQAPPERILMVGDSPRCDILGARALGMQTAQVCRGTVDYSDAAQLSLAELSDLLAITQRPTMVE